MIRAALDYAARGFRVLPLEPGGKNPLASLARHGSHQATDDPEVIRYWWSKVPRANVGLRLDHLLVIDLDARHDGESKWIDMTRGLRVPTCPVQRTPTSGLHLVFRRPEFPCVGKLASGVDVLHGFKYIVAAPSVRAEGRYVWEVKLDAVEVPEAPAWLLELVRRPEPKPAPVADVALPAERRADRARKYIAGMGPAIEGSGGDLHTFRVAVVLTHGFALDDSLGWALFRQWNATCQPPWTERALRRKYEQGRDCGEMPRGALLEDRRAA